MKLALQDEKEITILSASGVFNEPEVSCLDQWTPGPQKRSVMTSEENMKMEVSHELEKGNSQRLSAKKIGITHTIPCLRYLTAVTGLSRHRTSSFFL